MFLCATEKLAKLGAKHTSHPNVFVQFFRPVTLVVVNLADEQVVDDGILFGAGQQANGIEIAHDGLFGSDGESKRHRCSSPRARRRLGNVAEREAS